MAAVISGSFFYYVLPFFGQMYHLIRKIFVYKIKDRCVCIFLNNVLN